MNKEILALELELEDQTQVVWKGTNSNHTKAQKDFNNVLTKHSEAMQRVNEVETFLEIANKAYTSQIIPELTKQNNLEKQRLLLLSAIYTENKAKLSPKQKEDLQKLIMEECYDNLNNDRQFYLNIILQVETEAEKKERLNEKRKVEKELSKKLGFDVDFEELKKNDFSSEEEKEQHKEKFKTIFEEFSDNHSFFEDDVFGRARFKKERKKTKAQLEKEKKLAEAEKLLSTDINKLFKELAKLIHPDRELDEVLREKKAKLMTNLSNARDNMNIAEILSIKMQVDELIPNNSTDFSFNDSTIKRFVSVIKIKIKELENTISQKLYSHPLFEDFAPKQLSIDTVNKHINRVLKEGKAITSEMLQELEELTNHPKIVKEIVEEYRFERKQQNSFIDFSDFDKIFR